MTRTSVSTTPNPFNVALNCGPKNNQVPSLIVRQTVTTYRHLPLQRVKQFSTTLRYDNVESTFSNYLQTDVIYTDLSKTFDSTNHNLPILNFDLAAPLACF